MDRPGAMRSLFVASLSSYVLAARRRIRQPAASMYTRYEQSGVADRIHGRARTRLYGPHGPAVVFVRPDAPPQKLITPRVHCAWFNPITLCTPAPLLSRQGCKRTSRVLVRVKGARLIQPIHSRLDTPPLTTFCGSSHASVTSLRLQN
jgi:hypothetical protein